MLPLLRSGSDASAQSVGAATGIHSGRPGSRSPGTRQLQRVSMLGAPGPLQHTRDTSGLAITLPGTLPAGNGSVIAFAIAERGIAQS